MTINRKYLYKSSHYSSLFLVLPSVEKLSIFIRQLIGIGRETLCDRFNYMRRSYGKS